MLNHRSPFRSSLILLLASGASLVAQVTTGSLRGMVKDQAGKPLPQVRVTLESPALAQPRALVTDDKGEFQAHLLPIGTFDIKAVKTGFFAPVVKAVRVGIGTDQNLTIVMRKAEEAGGTVTVVGEAGSVETSLAADTVAVNVSGDDILRLPNLSGPTAALYQSLGNLLPGTGGSIMSAGIRGSGSSGAGAGGTVLLKVDGNDVRDDKASTNAPFYFPVTDAIEDVQMASSTPNARNGRAMGGQMNVVTKSGSNEFSGTFRALYSRPSWTTTNSHLVPTNAGQNYPDYINRSFQLTFGGPLWKDKVWFFFSAVMEPTRTGAMTANVPASFVTAWYPVNTWGANAQVDTVMNAGPSYAYPGTPYKVDFLSNGQLVAYDISRVRPDLKITAQLTPDHTLIVTGLFDKQKNKQVNPSFFTADLFEGMSEKNLAGTVSLRSVLSSTAFLEVNYTQASRNIVHDSTANAAPSLVYGRLDNGQSQPNFSTFYGPTFLMRNRQDGATETRGNKRFDFNLKLLRDFHGQHDFDLGGEFDNSYYTFGHSDATVFYAPGFYRNPALGIMDPASYLFPAIKFMGKTTNGQDKIDPTWGRYGAAPVMQVGNLADNTQSNQSWAAYINDNWRLNANWAVMLGLRWNHYTVKNVDGATMTTTNPLEPRFMLKWDPRGNGKDLLSFTANKFVNQFNTEITQQFAADPWNVVSFYGFNGAALPGGMPDPGTAGDLLNGNQMYGVRYLSYAQLTDPRNYNANAYGAMDPRQAYRTQGLQNPYTLEYALNYRHTTDSRGWFQVSTVQRTYYNTIQSYQDLNWDNWYIRTDPSNGSQLWQPATTYYNSSNRLVYQSAEASWQDWVTSRFTWGGAWTYAKTVQHGDDGAAKSFGTVKASLGLPITEQAWSGDGNVTRSQYAKIYGTYIYPVGKGELSFSTALSYSMNPWSSYAQNVTLNLPTGTFDAFTKTAQTHNGIPVSPMSLSTVTVQQYLGPKGGLAMGRDTWNLNLRIEWKFPVYQRVMLIGSLGIQGILNRAEQTIVGYLPNGVGSTNTAFISGRPMLNSGTFTGAVGTTFPGTSLESQYYGGDLRAFSDFSIGIRF